METWDFAEKYDTDEKAEVFAVQWQITASVGGCCARFIKKHEILDRLREKKEGDILTDKS